MSTPKSLINPKYKFPEYYQWPFFFTLQKHGATKRKQLTMWIELTLKFCQDNKVWRLGKNDFYENLGKNNKINRKISLEMVDIILQSMVQAKRAIWVNEKTKDEIFILWRTLNEWEDFIYQSAVKRQAIDAVETLEYISEDDDNSEEEYYKIDKDLLVKILKDLENQGKCNLLTNDNGMYIGVKFIK